jgi:hypothetical protein
MVQEYAVETIRLRASTKERLRASKVYERETDEDVVRRLLDEQEMRRDGAGQERRKAS